MSRTKIASMTTNDQISDSTLLDSETQHMIIWYVTVGS